MFIVTRFHTSYLKVVMQILFDCFRTRFRQQTYFDGEPHSPKGVCHVPMAHPFCDQTRDVSKPIPNKKRVRFNVEQANEFEPMMHVHFFHKLL